MKILKIVIEVVEGQPGLTRDLIETLWGEPKQLDEECDPEATNVG